MESQEDRSLATIAFGQCPWGKEIEGEPLFLEWEEGKDRNNV